MACCRRRASVRARWGGGSFSDQVPTCHADGALPLTPLASLLSRPQAELNRLSADARSASSLSRELRARGAALEQELARRTEESLRAQQELAATRADAEGMVKVIASLERQIGGCARAWRCVPLHSCGAARNSWAAMPARSRVRARELSAPSASFSTRPGHHRGRHACCRRRPLGDRRRDAAARGGGAARRGGGARARRGGGAGEGAGPGEGGAGPSVSARGWCSCW